MTMRVTGPERNDELVREAQALFRNIIKEDKEKKLDRSDASQRLLEISQKFLNAGALEEALLPARCIPLDDVRDEAICDVIRALWRSGKLKNVPIAYVAAGICVTREGKDKAEALMKSWREIYKLYESVELGASGSVDEERQHTATPLSSYWG